MVKLIDIVRDGAIKNIKETIVVLKMQHNVLLKIDENYKNSGHYHSMLKRIDETYIHLERTKKYLQSNF